MQRNIFLFGRKSIWSKELYLFDIKTYLSFRVESVSRQIGKAILLHFCLIVCHLTPDSLKSPQISNPPLVLRTTFPPQAGGTIKVPQTPNLSLRLSDNPLHYTGREAGRPGDILSFPESAHSMETGTEEPKPSQVSPAAPGAPTMKYPIKTPEERPVRHDGGKYGYTCSSLTTQIFRFGGCSWPIHRSRRPEPYRIATLG